MSFKCNLRVVSVIGGDGRAANIFTPTANTSTSMQNPEQEVNEAHVQNKGDSNSKEESSDADRYGIHLH